MKESYLARALRWLIYGSTLVPLIIFSQYVSPFHFGKVVVLRSVVEIMAVLYVLLIWRDRSYLPSKSPILWAVLAFAGAFTLTTITSVSHLPSFWGTLERMGGLFTFWHYVAFYVITTAVLRTRKEWGVLLNLMVGVGVLSAFYGFLQRTNLSFIIGSGGRQRIFGTIGNPALFAGYQILVAYLSLTLAFMSGHSTAWRRWYWGAGLTMVFAAALTVVRGSLLAMVVATILAILLYSILYHSQKAKKALLASITAVIVFVFLAILLRDTPLVQNSSYLRRITDFSPSTFTVQTRFWAWGAGLNGWSENPRTVLVGWGPENFNVPFSKYFNPKFFTGPGAETFFDRAHNMFVEVLVTMGLVGEITYLGIFVVLLIMLARFMKQEGDLKKLGIGFTALTVAYIIHNLFIFDTSANFLTFFMLLAYVTHVSLRGIDAAPIAKRFGPTRWTGLQSTAALALFVAVPMFIYTMNVRPALANYASTRAIVAGWQGDFVTAVTKYREAIAYDTPGRYEFRNSFVQYLLEVANSTDTSKIPDFDAVMLSAAEEEKKSIQESPLDYLPLLHLSRLYISLGKNDPKSPYNTIALEYSAAALEISPTFVRTYYEIAQAYLNIKDYPHAFEWFSKAATLNPDVAVTYWYMGVVRSELATQAKDIAGYREALKFIGIALEKGYTLSESDTIKVINMYVDLGDIKSVVPLYEHLTRIRSDNVQYWTSLAVAYAKTGRIPDAIAAVRKAISLDPNNPEFVAQANAFLRQLGAQP